MDSAKWYHDGLRAFESGLSSLQGVGRRRARAGAGAGHVTAKCLNVQYADRGLWYAVAER